MRMQNTIIFDDQVPSHPRGDDDDDFTYVLLDE